VQERSGQEGSRMALVATNVVIPIIIPNSPVPPVTPDGSTTVTFNSYGRVVANINGGANTIGVVEVTSPKGDRPIWVEIGAGGNIRTCDPSPLLSATDPRHC
jgi:hypothetical protein